MLMVSEAYFEYFEQIKTINNQVKSSQVKSALLSILPHVQYIHTEN